MRAEWTAYAIAKAFSGGQQKGQKAKKQLAEDEEVIDTTKPEFAEKFRGFVHTKSLPRKSKQPTNTEIKLG